MRHTVFAALCILVAVSGRAYADETPAAAPGAGEAKEHRAADDRKGEDRKGEERKGEEGKGGDSDSDDEDDRPGAPPVPDLALTDAQTTFRNLTIAARQKAIADAVGAGAATQAQRQEIGLHWRHIMRLLRIRELAEKDKADAIVKRVDALLARAQAKFTAKMAKIGGGAK
jgi:hypothetical protein